MMTSSVQFSVEPLPVLIERAITNMLWEVDAIGSIE